MILAVDAVTNSLCVCALGGAYLHGIKPSSISCAAVVNADNIARTRLQCYLLMCGSALEVAVKVA